MKENTLIGIALILFLLLLMSSPINATVSLYSNDQSGGCWEERSGILLVNFADNVKLDKLNTKADFKDKYDFDASDLIENYSISVSQNLVDWEEYDGKTLSKEEDYYLKFTGKLDCSKLYNSSGQLIPSKSGVDWIPTINGVEYPEYDWWDISWANYKDVNVYVSSGSTEQNYQVKLHVIYDENMNADFNDLRFIASDGTTELPHWKEEFTASTDANEWVTIDQNIDVNGYVFRMYYNNPVAESDSNGLATFLFFEDMSYVDEAAMVSAGWVKTGSPSLAFDGESVKVGASGPSQEMRKTIMQHLQNYGVDTRIKISAAGGVINIALNNFDAPAEIGDTDTYAWIYSNGTAQDFRWGANRWTTTSDITTNAFTDITWESSGTNVYAYEESVLAGTYSYTLPDVNHFAFGEVYNSGGGGVDVYVDNIRVRKYQSPSPSYTFGAEQSNSAPTVDSIIINPYAPVSDSNITASVSVNDADEDTLTMDANVYQDGSLIRTYLNLACGSSSPYSCPLLDYNGLVCPNIKVDFNVIVSDGIVTTSDSNTITISNSVPTISNLTPTTGTYGDSQDQNTISITCTATDIDSVCGQTITYTIGGYYDAAWHQLTTGDADGLYSWDISGLIYQEGVDINCVATDTNSGSSAAYNPTGTIVIDHNVYSATPTYAKRYCRQQTLFGQVYYDCTNWSPLELSQTQLLETQQRSAMVIIGVIIAVIFGFFLLMMAVAYFRR